jgi:carboxymethylenebutenolidase
MATIIEVSDFPAYLAEAKGECKGGLIVVHEVWGLTEHITNVADRFAAEGYLVLAPDLLTETGITEKVTPALQEDLFNPERRNAAQPIIRELTRPIQQPDFAKETVNKLRKCFDYLTGRSETNEKVAIVGFCFGGTYSFSLAVAEPRLKAAAPFYGHSDHTVAELGQITCPIMAFYGDDDERLILGLSDLKERMEQANVDFRAQIYPDCGHAFFNDTNKFAYNEVAAKAAWQKVLAFLDTNL